MDQARDFEELLQHAGWLRALARSLVADPATADDLVQETLRAAVVRPPRRDSTQAWLGQVLRNVAAQRFRSDSRRVRRERAAAKPEELPSSVELAARMELQRQMLESVLKLREPYRSTVVLRYYEGLSAAEIARKKGLPGGTVRSHLKRGLDELRSMLDRRYGGRRDTWSAVLIPWLDLKPETALASATALASGVLTMSTGLKLVLSVAIVAAAVVGYEVTQQGATGLEPAQPALEVAQAAQAAPAGGVGHEPTPPDLGAREAVPQALAADRSGVTLEVAYALTAMVVDNQLRPIGGARVWIEGQEQLEAVSDTQGLLAVAFDGANLDGANIDGANIDGTRRIRVSHVGFATLETTADFRRGASVDLGQVVLDPGGSITGRIVDTDGLPVSGAVVVATEADLHAFGLEMARRTGPGAGTPGSTTESDADGRFSLTGMGVGYQSLWAQAEETLWAVSDPIEVRAGEETSGIVLELTAAQPADVIAGLVLDPAGRPVPGCQVRCNYEDALSYLVRFTTTDDQGRFRILAVREEKHDIIASHPEGLWDDVSQLDLGPGTELVLRFAEARWIALEIVDSAGIPLEDASARALVGSEHSWRTVGKVEPTQEPGVLRLREPGEEFTIRALAEGCAEQTLGPFVPGSLPEVLRIVLEPIPGIHGRVLASGAPVGGAKVELFLLTLSLPDQFEVIHYGDFPVVVNPWPEETGQTDADGRFSFRAAQERGYVVRAERDGYAPAEWHLPDFDPSAGADDIELELTSGGAIEGEVVPPVGGVAAGIRIAVSRGDARHRIQRVAEDGHFLFEHLTPGRWNVEVLERGLDENPGARHSLVDSPPELPWVCEVFEGETTFHDLDLRQVLTCTVEGQLMVDDVPAASWMVRLDAASGHAVGSADVPQSLLDAEGGFELTAQEEGAYTLSLIATQAEGMLVLQVPLELRYGTLEWALDLDTAPVVVENITTPELRLLVWEGPDGVACRIPLIPGDDGVASVPRFPVGEIRVTTRPTRGQQWETMETLARAEHLVGETTRIVLP